MSLLLPRTREGVKSDRFRSRSSPGSAIVKSAKVLDDLDDEAMVLICYQTKIIRPKLNSTTVRLAQTILQLIGAVPYSFNCSHNLLLQIDVKAGRAITVTCTANNPLSHHPTSWMNRHTYLSNRTRRDPTLQSMRAINSLLRNESSKPVSHAPT